MTTSLSEHSSTPEPMKYEMQPYSREALPAILALLQQTLGDSGAVRKTEEFWKWKHHACPFGESYGLIAWDNSVNEIASLRVLMRWTFRAKGGVAFRGARAVDTATHPAHQRRGLFSSLTRQAISDLTEQGVDFIFNTPNRNSLPGYLKMGWQEAARWPLYLRPLRPIRMAYRQLRPISIQAAINFADHFSPGILPWHSFVQQHGDQLEGLLATWEHNRRQVGLRTVRTLDYYAWRYGGHPHIQYGVYPHTDQLGHLQGFAILRPNGRFGWQETVLTELCLAQQDMTLGVRMLQDLARQLKSDYLIAHFASRTLELELLRHSNFWMAPRHQIIFTVRQLRDAALQFCQADAWDLTLGDLELF